MTLPGWTFEPVVAGALLLAAALYAAGAWRLWARAGVGSGLRVRDAVWFALGWLTLALALTSPLHELGESLFSAHMLQHELLLGLATPLIVLGRPLVAFVWALPSGWRPAAGSIAKRRSVAAGWEIASLPMSAFALHSVSLWLWHAPSFYQATLTSEWVHAAQHTTFIAAGLLFWWSVLSARGSDAGRSRGAAVACLFGTVLVTGALGALLTFSSTLWYPAYASTAGAWGFTPLEDQQLGGLIMWIPGGVPYAIAGVWLFAEWLRESERRMTLSARAAAGAAVVAMLLLVAQGCDKASGDDTTMVPGGNAGRGHDALRKYGCVSCHVVPGVEGANGLVGPPLAGIAGRVYIAGVLPNTPDNMIRWIMNPQAVDSKTAMPFLGVTEGDARDISAYLYSRK